MDSSLASQYLTNELTVFAPSDAAMAKYTGKKDDQFILNHMGKKHFLWKSTMRYFEPRVHISQMWNQKIDFQLLDKLLYL